MSIIVKVTFRMVKILSCSFVLKQKNQKLPLSFLFFLKESANIFQDLKTLTKILNNFLKFPNSGGNIDCYWILNFCRHSNTGNFLTKIIQNFLTPPFSRSINFNIGILFFNILKSFYPRNSIDVFELFEGFFELAFIFYFEVDVS